jgi:hypothetical protein
VLGWLSPSLRAFQFDPNSIYSFGNTGDNPSEQYAWPSQGDMDRDFLVDVALLIDGSAHVMYGCNIYVARVPIRDEDASPPSSAASHLEFLPADSPLGGDAVVVAETDGVRRYVLGSDGSWSMTLLAGLNYASARRVRCLDLDASGTMDVLLLDSQGLTVAAVFDANTSQPSDPIVLFQHPVEIHELIGLNFMPAVGAELALVDELGTAVLDASGAVVYVPYLPGVAGDLLVALSNARTPLDKLVWIGQSSGQWSLTVIHPEGTEASVALGALQLVSASAGDLTGDGLQDLLLSREGFARIVQLNQRREGPSFSATQGSSEHSFGIDYPPDDSVQAWVTVCDLDGDGDQDGFVLRETAGIFGDASHFYRMLNGLIEEDLQKPQVVGGWYSFDVPAFEGDFLIDLQIPEQSPWDELQLILWNQPSLLETHMDADAIYHGLFSVSPGVSTVQFSLPGEYTPSGDALIHVLARLVDVSDGVVVDAAPPTTVTVAANLAAEDIRQAASADPVEILVLESFHWGPVGGSGASAGVVHVPNLPSPQGQGVTSKPPLDDQTQ